jgi:hypothetical protein
MYSLSLFYIQRCIESTHLHNLNFDAQKLIFTYPRMYLIVYLIKSTENKYVRHFRTILAPICVWRGRARGLEVLVRGPADGLHCWSPWSTSGLPLPSSGACHHLLHLGHNSPGQNDVLIYIHMRCNLFQVVTEEGSF